jgi:ribonuclease P/MRP protein subunit POP5
MRHLPKHLRPRYRYLAVEVETWPDAEFDRGEFADALGTAARSLLGDAETAAIDLRVVDLELEAGGGSAIVRVRRNTVDRARAAVACVDAVAGQPVRIGVRGVGGTLRATEEQYRGAPPQAQGSETAQFRDQQVEAFDRDDRVDLRIDQAFVGAIPEDL